MKPGPAVLSRDVFKGNEIPSGTLSSPVVGSQPVRQIGLVKRRPVGEIVGNHDV